MDDNVNHKDLYNSLCRAVAAYRNQNKGTSLGVAASNYVYETYQEVFDDIKLHQPMLDPFYDSGKVEAFLNAVADLIPVKYSKKVMKPISNQQETKSANADEPVDNADNIFEIPVPEGKHIDLEASDLSKGIIVFEENAVTTFKDICDKLRAKNNPNHMDKLEFYSNLHPDTAYESFLKVITKLRIIALVLNEGWNPITACSNGRSFMAYHNDFYFDRGISPNIIGAVLFKDDATAEKAMSMLTKQDIQTLKDYHSIQYDS